MSRVRRITLLLLIPAIVVAAALWWLLASEAGTRWSLQQAAKALPGVTVEGVSGNWLDGPRLGAVGYDDGSGTRARMVGLRLDWLPAALLRGAVRITSLDIERLQLQLPPAAPDEPTVLPDLLLPWPVSVTRVSVGELAISQGEAHWEFVDLGAGLRLDRDGIRLRALALSGHGVSVTGQLALGPAPRHAIDARLHWQLDEPLLGGELTVSGDIRGLQVRQRLEGDVRAEVWGRVLPDLEKGEHRVELEGRWSEFVLATADGPVRIEGGDFTLAGRQRDYRLDLNARLHDPLDGAWQLRLGGQGDAHRLQVQAARLEGPVGRLELSGTLSWSPVLAASLRVSGSDLDPAGYLGEWPGRLNLEALVDAALPDSGPELVLRVERLDGVLRGQAVEAGGRLQMRGDQLRLSGVALRSGANQAWIEGSLLPQLDLSARVDAPRLEQVAPGLAGALQGNVRVSGAIEQLALAIEATGRDLTLGELRLAHLDLAGEAAPADAARSHWRLSGQGLSLAGERVDELRVEGSGNAATHRFRVELGGPRGSLRGQAEGSYRASAWQGRLTGLVLASPPLGEWRLAGPTAITLQADEQRIAPLCLLAGEARLCAGGSRDSHGALRLEADWDGLPLAMIQPWLALDAAVSGSLSGSLRAEGAIEAMHAHARMRLSPGEIRVRSEDATELVTAHRDGELRLDYAAGRLSANGGWRLGEQGELQAALVVEAPRATRRELSGELAFDLPDPTPFAVLFSRITQLGGPVSLRASLSGTVERPAVHLAGRWREGRLQLPDLGIDLTGIDVDVQGDGDSLQLAARAHSAPGTLRASGRLRLDAAADWPVRLRVEGEDFTVFRSRDLEARITPALELRGRRGLIEAEGRLLVPYARIVGNSLPRGAVRPSEDEVLVGQTEGLAQETSAGPQVKADIELVLGEQVSVDAEGLTGRLTGGLRVVQEPGARPEGSGQLEIVEGRYRAYGQDLTIERGRLLFGGPLENPDVDVRASRRIDKVTAGVVLGGRLADPSAELFSEPAMDQADVLSYLLTGGPVGASGSLSPVMLAEAAAGLGLEKSGDIASQLAARLGLDEFTIESGAGGLESSTMAIGKRLSPDLYLRYLYGLFDNTAAVQIRYHVSERVRVEVQEGQQRAADLIYEFERD